MNFQKLYKSISIIGAALLWGSWTYFVNEGGYTSRLTSAVCQGVFSGFATALMFSVLVSLSKRIKNIFTASLIITLCTAVCALLIHCFINTANIFVTISPPVCTAFIYSLFTSYSLKQDSRRESVKCQIN